MHYLNKLVFKKKYIYFSLSQKCPSFWRLRNPALDNHYHTSLYKFLQYNLSEQGHTNFRITLLKKISGLGFYPLNLAANLKWWLSRQVFTSSIKTNTIVMLITKLRQDEGDLIFLSIKTECIATLHQILVMPSNIHYAKFSLKISTVCTWDVTKSTKIWHLENPGQISTKLNIKI